jgi:hypothetical protein
VIYTGRDLWRAAVGGVQGAQWGPLWLAGYVPNAYVPGSGDLKVLAAKVGANRGGLPWGGWSSAAFLQFTEKGTCPGITGAVDGDLFLGSADELAGLGGDVVALTAVAARTRDAILAVSWGFRADGKPYTLGDMLVETRDSARRAADVTALAEAVASRLQQGVPGDGVQIADVRQAVADVLQSVHV